MYWCIEKTTSNERTIINNAVYAIFADLEKAETLINTVIEECFDSAEQKKLSSCEAEWVGTMLHITRDILTDAITAYHLTVADTGSVRAQNFIKAAETAKTAMQCEDAYSGVYELEKRAPAEKRKAIMETRAKIGDMDDAAAIIALNALAKNGGENNG